VEQSHAEVLGVETSNQAEYSIDGWKHMREANRLLFDARECGRTIFLAQTEEVT